MKAGSIILIKLTGELLARNTEKEGVSFLDQVVQQLAQLHKQLRIGIVIGGGNFFRGTIQGAYFKMHPWNAHTVGMFATIMNGIILADLLEQNNVPTTLFSALNCPQAGLPITSAAIQAAQEENRIMIFAGGTGNPFFTTDTNAVLRALQIGASEIWKASTVDGIYDQDPQKNKAARLLKKVSYQQALDEKLGVMDLTALSLAAEHKMRVRIFTIFSPNALIAASQDEQFGSLIEV